MTATCKLQKMYRTMLHFQGPVIVVLGVIKGNWPPTHAVSSSYIAPSAWFPRALMTGHHDQGSTSSSHSFVPVLQYPFFLVKPRRSYPEHAPLVGESISTKLWSWIPFGMPIPNWEFFWSSWKVFHVLANTYIVLTNFWNTFHQVHLELIWILTTML